MLSAAELGLLARVDLVLSRPQVGLFGGLRRSRRAARSPEFFDFRPYVSGDDFRQIDWKAFARLDRLTLRLYVAEEEATLNILVDSSASMRLGSMPKWQAAARLAEAFAFLGLSAMDRVAVGLLDGSQRSRFLRGRGGLGDVRSLLATAEPAGGGGPAELASLPWLRAGLTVVISDFLGHGGWGAALAGLRRKRHEVVLWQILAAEEERPDLSGDLKLVDVESNQERELTVTPWLVSEYRSALAEHRARLRRWAQDTGGRFVHSLSADSLEATLAAGMRAGVFRR